MPSITVGLSKISWTNKSLLLQHLLINSTLLHELPSHNGFFKNFFFFFYYKLFLFITCFHFSYTLISFLVWCIFVIHALFDANNNNNNNNNNNKNHKKIKIQKLKKIKIKENFGLGALGSLVTFPTPFKAQLKMVSLRPTISIKMDLFMIILQKLQKMLFFIKKKKNQGKLSKKKKIFQPGALGPLVDYQKSCKV